MDTQTIILSPAVVGTGSPVGQALENIITNKLADGALCYVIEGPAKGEWQLDKSASGPPDGTTVIAPIGGPGRWLKLDALAPAIPALSAVLGVGNDANGERIVNLANGVDPQDAATVAQISGIQTPYTVSKRAGVGRFTTIQAAVDQAIADGASGTQPVTIYIDAGYYDEPVVASGGGIVLCGQPGTFGTYVTGPFDFTNAPAGTSVWHFVGLVVEQAVNIVGTTNKRVRIDNCELLDGLNFTSASGLSLVVANSSRIRKAAGGDVISFAAGVATFVEIYSSRIEGGLGSVVLATNQLRMIGSRTFGAVTVRGNSSSILNSVIYADGIPCVIDETTTVSEIMGNTFWQNAAGVECFRHTGAGQLTQVNFYADSATAPYLVNTGGPVLTGGLVA